LATVTTTAKLLLSSSLAWDGQPLRHSNFYRRVWMPAAAAIGLAGVHLHDLRHTANQFIADEVLSAASNMAVDLLFHWRARQDSNPRPAA